VSVSRLKTLLGSGYRTAAAARPRLHAEPSNFLRRMRGPVSLPAALPRTRWPRRRWAPSNCAPLGSIATAAAARGVRLAVRSLPIVHVHAVPATAAAASCLRRVVVHSAPLAAFRAVSQVREVQPARRPLPRHDPPAAIRVHADGVDGVVQLVAHALGPC
jgi:hypothetical protein